MPHTTRSSVREYLWCFSLAPTSNMNHEREMVNTQPVTQMHDRQDETLVNGIVVGSPHAFVKPKRTHHRMPRVL
jgi:hypothetical protein